MAKTLTAAEVKDTIDRQGVIFATRHGRKMVITHDEDCNGIYAWPDGEDGAEAFFGDDEDAYGAIAEWLAEYSAPAERGPTNG